MAVEFARRSTREWWVGAVGERYVDGIDGGGVGDGGVGEDWQRWDVLGMTTGWPAGSGSMNVRYRLVVTGATGQD